MKVLVVSHNPFSKTSNNGKTLNAIFSQIDPRDITQLYFNEDLNMDLTACHSFYKLTDKNILKSLKTFKAATGIVQNHTTILPPARSVGKYVKSYKTFSLKYLRDGLWQLGKWRSDHLMQWCNSHKPDLIFYVGGNYGFSHTIARTLSDNLSIPLAVYFTDDYLIYPTINNMVERIHRNRMRHFYQKTIDAARGYYAIGKTMALEYQSYFNQPFLPIMNTVPVKEFQTLPDQDLVISYFGGLHLGRDQMILRLAQALENIVLQVYTMQSCSDSTLKQFENAGVVFKGGVTGEALDKAIKNSSMLLHVESDDLYYRSLTKLSVSTKIPEYLMASRPILAYGPIEVASMQLLSDNDIGFIIDSSLDNDSLKNILNKIVKNKKQLVEMAVKGHSFATVNFNSKTIASQFKKSLEKLITNEY